MPGGHGAQPRVQQQVVPLSYGSDMQPPKPQATIPAPPAEQPEAGEAEESDNDTERALNAYRATRRLAA